jgi:hypothetical protein
VANPERLLHAVGIVVIVGLTFLQGYDQYKKYAARSDVSGAMVVAMQVMLAVWVILGVAGVLWNILGAFGLMRI